MAETKSTGIEDSFGLQPEALELVRGVFRGHPEVQRVAIFGSRALGRFEEQSDIDLALWEDLSPGLVAQIMRELDELPLPYTSDVKAYGAIRHEPLKRHIDEFGKTFYRGPGSSCS